MTGSHKCWKTLNDAEDIFSHSCLNLRSGTDVEGLIQKREVCFFSR